MGSSRFVEGTLPYILAQDEDTKQVLIDAGVVVEVHKEETKEKFPWQNLDE